MRVTHVITGLDTGGAEMMLYKLLATLDRTAFLPDVISLTDIGPIGKRIQSLGVPVRGLGMQFGLSLPADVLRLARLLRKEKPDLVQTWMYHADLVGGLAAYAAGRLPTVWNVQNSSLDPKRSKRTTLLTASACARLSRYLPKRIICCAEEARRLHAASGYDRARMDVIPNGFDLCDFHPDPQARPSVRQELGLPADTFLIGLIGRFHPQKDYETFAEAAGILCRRLSNVSFLLCGREITPENTRLVGWLEAASVLPQCHLLGVRADIPRISAALDIGTLSSAFGEAFPNVLGEAMACGVPCVATDVGDCRMIIADTGLVVAPRQPEALAHAWQEIVELESQARCELGKRARRHISDHFSLDRVTAQYEALYREVAGCAV